MHIDIRVAREPPWDLGERERGIRAKVAELAAPGAMIVREDSDGERLDHVGMLDPEGNEFWVA
jgi:Glyoxalase-like domain